MDVSLSLFHSFHVFKEDNFTLLLLINYFRLQKLSDALKTKVHESQILDVICDVKEKLQTLNLAFKRVFRLTYEWLKQWKSKQFQSLTPPQPFYDPFSGTTRVSRCQKRTSGLYGARED